MNENNEFKEELGKSPKKVDNKRRSLAKAGLVAPVMMTLANRPAWGANVRCTISGFNSVEFAGGSGDLGTYDNCGYISISNIKSILGDKIDEKLNTYPGFSGISSGVGNQKIGKILDGDKGEWYRFIFAAAFNAQDGNNPFGKCPVTDVVNHFEESLTPFDFGNCELTQDQVQAFLQTVISE